MVGILFPSPKVESITHKVVDYFASDSRVFAVILYGSVARGQAEPDCTNVDSVVFIYPNCMEEFFETKEMQKRIDYYKKIGGTPTNLGGSYGYPDTVEFGDISLDLLFRDDIKRKRTRLGICTDNFEIAVGNFFVYCVPLYERDNTYRLLAKKYLPFYSESIRKERLEAIMSEFNYRTEETKRMAQRGDFFASFSGLRFLYTVFLQHLFIKRRVYPFHYVKWVKYQLSNLLHEPQLYDKLVQVFILGNPSTEVLKTKVSLLCHLMREYGGKSF